MRKPARISKSSPPKNPYSRIKREHGKRSGLEVYIATQLSVDLGLNGFKEEKDIESIEYTILKPRKYHPDFQLPNGIYIEAKGWFKTADRQKHLALKYQHPELDIRFVFSNSKNKIGKKSNTTYGMWCAKNGFKYSDLAVPQGWINEPKKGA